MRRSTALVKPLAAAHGFSTSSEKIVASVLFERLPVVIPKLDPAVYAFQEFSFRWKQQYRRKYPDEFLDMSKSRGKGDYHIEYVPAPRITEADKTNDRNSLQRVLDRRLYLGNSHGAPSGKAVNKSPFFSLGTSRMAFSTKRSKTSSLARTCLSRCMSNVPENTVYGGPTPQTTDQRVTLNQLKQKYKKGEPITVVTAYDYPSAVHVDMAGIDICLVGDSAAMVVHGYDTTLPITLDEMLVHCRAVARGAKRPLLVGDLPFGTYETSTNQAVDTAVKVLKEGGMDAIKLEGGSSARIAAAKAIVEAGIAVMGHVGLTPQAISVLGGFRPQGKNVSSAMKVVETAMALQEAGCFAVVLECVPAPLAAAVTSALQIPTIGIGAGPFCSGQVLVYHDLLGMFQHPHHAMVTPKFCKQYASVGDNINKALLEYKKEVNDGSFPGASHTPYKMNPNDVDGFLEELEKLGLDKAASAATTAAEKMNTAQQPDSDKSQK